MINKNKKLKNNIKFNRRKEINKMKTRIFTICIMVMALALFAPVANADFKATGGGWIPVGDSKASFGFQIKCEEFIGPLGSAYYECTGNVQYNDHDNNINIHSTEYLGCRSAPFFTDKGKGLEIEGVCKIQDKGFKDEIGSFRLDIEDNSASSEENPGVTIRIYDNFGLFYSAGNLPVLLGGGNINIKD